MWSGIGKLKSQKIREHLGIGLEISKVYYRYRGI